MRCSEPSVLMKLLAFDMLRLQTQSLSTLKSISNYDDQEIITPTVLDDDQLLNIKRESQLSELTKFPEKALPHLNVEQYYNSTPHPNKLE